MPSNKKSQNNKSKDQSGGEMVNNVESPETVAPVQELTEPTVVNLGESSLPDVVPQTGGATNKKSKSKPKVEPKVDSKVDSKEVKSKPKKSPTTEVKPKKSKEKSEKPENESESKPSKKVKSKKPEENDDEEKIVNGKLVRSFKVKLPDKETFEGRFTGLTPYQAANKALSKYFRESGNIDSEVTFSICESTRKSKRSVYVYTGKRYKLDVPVSYKIQDGREIVKNYKNLLKKIKKSDIVDEEN